MAWDPSSRVAVVTGASSGIGEATTRELARAGMTVYAVARRTDLLEALAREHGGVVAHAADVADQASVDALAARVAAEHGACHALINSAGVGGEPFEGRDDLEDALRTIDVNLCGTFRCLAAFAPLLEAGAPSRVVNVGSVAGKLGIGPAAYAASKFGVVGLSEALAFSWRSRGISVCQLNPGYIRTEGFTQEQFSGTRLEGLLGRPEDVGRAILGVLRTGRGERTVPAWYRSFVVLRHLAPPLYRAAASRMARARGTRAARPRG